MRMRLSTSLQILLRVRRRTRKMVQGLSFCSIQNTSSWALDSLRRRRVVEKVSSGLEGIRLQAGLTEDFKKYPLCQGRLAVLQLLYGARDDVTESRDVCCGTSGKGGW